MKTFYIHDEINQKIHPEIHNVIIRSFNFENFFIMKLNEYLINPELCLKEYKISCGGFFVKNMRNSINFIKKTLGKMKENWKWRNLNIKQYYHNPFSTIPVLDKIFHKTAKTDVNLF